MKIKTGLFGCWWMGLIGASLHFACISEAAPGFTYTGSLGTNRYDHTATLLANGKVLVAGGLAGFAETNYLQSAELYDPSTES